VHIGFVTQGGAARQEAILQGSTFKNAECSLVDKCDATHLSINVESPKMWSSGLGPGSRSVKMALVTRLVRAPTQKEKIIVDMVNMNNIVFM
jgi:hypothetical protein